MKSRIDSRGGNPANANAPVFVRSAEVFFRSHTKPFRANRGTDWCFYFTGVTMPLYLFAFAAAEAWLPGLYRAWVELFLPLTEYVGSLTPRAGEKAEWLIANGYPERAEFAKHAIAMSRVLVLPSVVGALVAFFASIAKTQKTRLVVACTRKTRTLVFLVGFCGLVIFPMLALSSEWFVDEFGVGRGYFLFIYHRFNTAVAGDMIFACFAVLFLWVLSAMVVTVRTHFHIVEKEPE